MLNEKDINETIKQNEQTPKYKKNFLSAFFVGGMICLIGQGINYVYTEILVLEADLASSLMVITLVLIATLLTGLGIYDKIGQFAGCGSIVPVTGFANSMTSSAMESRSEGVILGISPNIFKLAGTVITIGVVSAYLFGSIRYFIEQMM